MTSCLGLSAGLLAGVEHRGCKSGFPRFCLCGWCDTACGVGSAFVRAGASVRWLCCGRVGPCPGVGGGCLSGVRAEAGACVDVPHGHCARQAPRPRAGQEIRTARRRPGALHPRSGHKGPRHLVLPAGLEPLPRAPEGRTDRRGDTCGTQGEPLVCPRRHSGYRRSPTTGGSRPRPTPRPDRAGLRTVLFRGGRPADDAGRAFWLWPPRRGSVVLVEGFAQRGQAAQVRVPDESVHQDAWLPVVHVMDRRHDRRGQFC